MYWDEDSGAVKYGSRKATQTAMYCVQFVHLAHRNIAGKLEVSNTVSHWCHKITVCYETTF